MENYFKSETCIKKNDTLYFVLIDLSLLCSYSLKNKETKIVSKIPWERLFTDRLCGKLLTWKDTIIILPLNGKSIYMYDLNEDKWEKISVYNEDLPNKFLEGMVYKDCLFAFGHWYGSIVKVNLCDFEIEYIDISRYKKDSNEIIGTQIVGVDEKVYLPLCQYDKILVFDMDNSTIEEISINNNEKGFTAIQYYNNQFVALSRIGQQMIIWDGKNNYNTIKGILPDYNDLYFHGVIINNSEIVLPSTHEKEINYFVNDKMDCEKINSCVLFCNKVDDYTYVTMDENGLIVLYEKEKKTEFYCKIDINMLVEYLKGNKLLNNEFLRENNKYMLNFLLDCI